MSKMAAAKRVIAYHFSVQPELQEVYYIGPDTSTKTPIKLLEINEATPATGAIEPFVFAATDEMPYTTAVAEITPDELKHFKAHPEDLPGGWSLAGAKHFRRPVRMVGLSH